MKNHVVLPYGNKKISFTIPDQYRYDIGYLPDSKVLPNPENEIKRSLHTPIGTSRLSAMIQGKKDALILIDDNTRPTPAHQILPIVIEQIIQGGLPLNRIKILIATGTHRPLTSKEVRLKLGNIYSSKINIINHDYRKKDELIHMGTTTSDIPIVINKHVVKADFVIGIGNIMPHRYCGWTGGAKIVQPGVCGAETTSGTHLLMARDPEVHLGIVENRVRSEMESVAESVNLGFLINTILNKEGKIVHVVSGDFRKAFREGAHKAKNIYKVSFCSRSEITIVSSFPFDQSFWQAGKALYAAELVTKDDGAIIFLSPCFEGWGEHPELVYLIGKSVKEINSLISCDKIKDRIAAAAALAIARITQRVHIYIVSDNNELRKIEGEKSFFFLSIQDALENALRFYGTNARINIIPEASMVLPVVHWDLL